MHELSVKFCKCPKTSGQDCRFTLRTCLLPVNTGVFCAVYHNAEKKILAKAIGILEENLG